MVKLKIKTQMLTNNVKKWNLKPHMLKTSLSEHAVTSSVNVESEISNPLHSENFELKCRNKKS